MDFVGMLVVQLDRVNPMDFHVTIMDFVGMLVV